ncbi:TetR/AcrR family transcriptional regulator [Allorhizobium undicola]|uniref:TetR/AcrR family transcriptional regulator n=1 Tax=Allorhizobium undicola TaxID=78527 RepID=UPI003D326B3B
MAEASTPPAPDGRERKRQETIERIVTAAWNLFLSNGYGETTMEDIAKAADVSRRSVFNHFSRKDEILFARMDQYASGIASKIAARSAVETPFQAVIAVLGQVTEAARPTDIQAMVQMFRRDPALASGRYGYYSRFEQAILTALRQGWGGRETDDRLILCAMSTAGLLRLSVDRWTARKGEGRFSDCLDQLAAMLPDALRR